MAEPRRPFPVLHYIPVPHYYAESAEVKFFVTQLLAHMNASSVSWTELEERAAKGPVNGHQLHGSTREEWEAIYPVEGSSIHTYIHRNKDAYVSFRLDVF